MCLHSQESLKNLERSGCKPLCCLHQNMEYGLPDELLIYKATLSSISLLNGVHEGSALSRS